MKRSILSFILTLNLLAIISFDSTGFASNREFAKYKRVKIAMAQIVSLDGDKAGNMIRIKNAIMEAQKKHAKIIVFPESCLLGWVNPEAYNSADPIPGKDSEQICRLAKKYKLYICIGLDEKDGKRLYDSAILIDDKGHILLKHRKINVLPALMDPPYSIGNGVGVVKTKFGTIGIMICADSYLDNLLDEMRMQRPDLLLIPYGWTSTVSNWPARSREFVGVVTHAAKRTGCPVIGTNLIGQIVHGPWSGQIFGGQSVSYDINKKSLTVGKDRERDIVMVTVWIRR